jgi:hypothetical protein
VIIPKSLPTLLILFLPCFLFAQEVKPAADFSKADSLAMTIKYEHDIYRLTRELTEPFPEQILKVRAIFRWITYNIRYDYKFYNRYDYRGKEPKPFTCRGDSMECAIKLNVYETRYVNKVLDKKKAVCQGYAMLFKKMCNIAGIEAEVIPGYTRSEYYEVGTVGDLNHAWNTVLLNGNYYLLDATWAAGGCFANAKGKLLFFIRSFKEYYWLTPADDFARNHYPEDGKWVLIPKYTKQNFSSNPYYAPDELSNIKLITPYSGVINVKKGDTIRFKLKLQRSFHDLQINSNIFQNPDIWYVDYSHNKRRGIARIDTDAVKKQQYIKYKRNNDIYEFSYPVKDNSLVYLDIMFDRKRVMRFNVNDRR